MLRKRKTEIISALIGAAVGYAYYRFIGCASGTCMITSSPVNSTLYGTLMGWLVGGMFRRNEQKEQTVENQS